MFASILSIISISGRGQSHHYQVQIMRFRICDRMTRAQNQARVDKAITRNNFGYQYPSSVSLISWLVGWEIFIGWTLAGFGLILYGQVFLNNKIWIIIQNWPTGLNLPIIKQSSFDAWYNQYPSSFDNQNSWYLYTTRTSSHRLWYVHISDIHRTFII